MCFRNSELLSGNLCKKTLGGQKGGLYYVLLRDHGADAAARCMNRLAKLCGRLIGGHRGFSIGIDDVMPAQVLLDLKVRPSQQHVGHVGTPRRRQPGARARDKAPADHHQSNPPCFNPIQTT